MTTSSRIDHEAARFVLSSVTLRPESLMPVFGGRSKAAKFVAEDHDGRQLFIKVAHDRDSRAVRLLEREAAIVSQLQTTKGVPAFIDFHRATRASVLVTEHIVGTHEDHWTMASAAAAFRFVSRLYTEFERRLFNAPKIEAEPRRFRSFSEIADLPRLRDLPGQQQRWITKHIEKLRLLEGEGRILVPGEALLHCDLAADNVIVRPSGEVVLVDWAHAHLGNPLYDMATMLIRIRAEDAWSSQVEADLRADSRVSQAILPAMVTLATGSFLQASAGEIHTPSSALAKQRLSYAIAGLEWLKEIV